MCIADKKREYIFKDKPILMHSSMQHNTDISLVLSLCVMFNLYVIPTMQPPDPTPPAPHPTPPPQSEVHIKAHECLLFCTSDY